MQTFYLFHISIPESVEKMEGTWIEVPVYRVNPYFPRSDSAGSDGKPHWGSRLHQLFWIIACLIGFVYQTVLVTVDYTKYPVTSHVTIEIENEFIPPALSFCFTSVRIRIPERFPPDNVCSKNFTIAAGFDYSTPEEEECDDHMIYKTNRDVLLSYLTQDLVHSIKSLKIAENTAERQLHINSTSQLTEYLTPFYRDKLKCVRFQYKDGAKLKLGLISSLVSYKKKILYLNGSCENFQGGEPVFTVYVHEMNTFPRGYTLQDVQGQFQRQAERKYLNYKSIITQYLPPPFFSDCTDRYETSGLESQEHCIDSCVEKRLHDLNPNLTAASLTYTKLRPNMIRSKAFDDNFMEFYDHYSECSKKCPLACNTSFYQLFRVSQYPDAPATFQLVLRSEYPTTRVVFSPKLTMLEYLIYIASCGSLWFGFSIISLRSFVEWCGSRCSTRKSIGDGRLCSCEANNLRPRYRVRRGRTSPIDDLGSYRSQDVKWKNMF